MDIVDALKWYLVFVFSTSFHEAAHAWSAWKLGDDTAYRGGQATLDPTPHIRREPLGMIVVPILSYLFAGWMIGWASAPYNPAWAVANPRRAGLMALAGPAANFILVLLAGLLIRSGIELHFFQAPPALGMIHMTQAINDGWPDFAAKTLSIFFSLNLLLCVFNLIPIPPLDGASIVLLFCNARMARGVFGIIKHPVLGRVGIFIAWKFFGQIFQPILGLAGHLLYPDVFFP